MLCFLNTDTGVVLRLPFKSEDNFEYFLLFRLIFSLISLSKLPRGSLNITHQKSNARIHWINFPKFGQCLFSIFSKLAVLINTLTKNDRIVILNIFQNKSRHTVRMQNGWMYREMFTIPGLGEGGDASQIIGREEGEDSEENIIVEKRQGMSSRSSLLPPVHSSLLLLERVRSLYYYVCVWGFSNMYVCRYVGM